MKPDPLHELRNRIDKLDEEILSALSRRYKILEEVVKVKDKNNIPYCVPARVEEVLNKNAERGKELGMPEEYVRDLWTRIIDEAHRFEKSKLKKDE